MASTYLTRTSTAGNRQKFTTSFWFKLAKADSTRMSFFSATETTDGNELSYMRVDDKIWIRESHSNNSDLILETNRIFRDINAWYHIVFTVDTTQATNTNRLKMYVNGVQETSFAYETYPSQNYNTRWNESGQVMQIGRNTSGYPYYFDGSISHFHHCDGYAYDASAFGFTDSTTGEWKINTSPNVSYGNNGFFILKDGNSVTDSSPNTNNFTVAGGTLTKTEDNPSNNFATINPLQSFSSGSLDIDFANTRVRGNGSTWMRANAGLAAKSGKWYYEAYIQHTTSGRPIRLGWDSADNPNNGSDTYYSGFNISTDGYIRGGVNGYNNYDPNATALGVTFTTGDYIGLAIDIDGDTVTAYKNGTVISNVNALSLSGFTYCSVKKSRGHWITPSVVFYSQSNNDNRTEFNFGNGAFANTQLTGTTYTDSAGFGVFKYQPPTGYLAWCTKNLNQ